MLNKTLFGLAGGLVWGITVFTFTWIAAFTGYGAQFFSILKMIYPPYEVSAVGSLVGFICGFFHGYLSLYFASAIYNHFGRVWSI